jgi:hypothetical protein
VIELERDLRAVVRGEVGFDPGSRALYSTDASNYRHVPIGVVLPRSIEDVLNTVAAARRADAPILSRGAGTSLAGQCCNAAVVIDFSRHLNRVLDLDPQQKTARVEPGVVLDRLRESAEEHGDAAFTGAGGAAHDAGDGVRAVGRIERDRACEREPEDADGTRQQPRRRMHERHGPSAAERTTRYSRRPPRARIRIRDLCGPDISARRPVRALCQI